MSVTDNQLRLQMMTQGADSVQIIQKGRPVFPESLRFDSVGGNQVIPSASNEVVNFTKTNLTAIPPVNPAFITSFFATSQSNYLEFTIDNNLNGPLTRADFVFQFTVGAGGVTLVPTFLWFKRLEVLSNSPTVSETYSNAQELAIDMLLALDDLNSVDVFCQQHGTTSTLAATAYPAGSYTRLLSLNSTFLQAMNVVTGTLKRNIIVRLYPDDFPTIATAGVLADCTLTGASMTLNYLNLPPMIGQEVANRIASQEIITPFISPVTYQVNTAPVSFVSGTNVSFQLNSINEGLCAGIVVYASSTTINAANKYGLNMDGYTFQLLDSNGVAKAQPVTGSYLLYDNTLETGDVLLQKPSNTFKTYMIRFYGKNSNISQGRYDGGIFMKQTDRLQITPNANNANFNVFVVGLYYRQAIQRNGEIIVSQ